MADTDLLLKKVAEYYEASDRKLGQLMWRLHVRWVADKAKALATKYNADQTKVYAGGLLHDLGDVWYERDDPQHESEGISKARELLRESGFKTDDIEDIITNIIEPHSCYPDNMPTTLEGKVLATADAMFHLQTDFFPRFCWRHIPEQMTYEEWTTWVAEKLERDMYTKIFFKDEREEVRPHYEALKLIFAGNDSC